MKAKTPSKLEKILAAGHLGVTSECGPPRGSDPEVIKEKLVVAPTKLYYVVAGSFSNEINANKLVAILRQKGYNATIADTTKNGMYRVAYLGLADLELAKQELFAIRQEDNPDAWIFRK